MPSIIIQSRDETLEAILVGRKKNYNRENLKIILGWQDFKDNKKLLTSKEVVSSS